MGNERNSLRSDTFISYPFSAKRKLQSPQRKVKVKSNTNVKTNVKASPTANQKHRCLTLSDMAQLAASLGCLSPSFNML
jgi:hypothetical protein